MQNNERWRLRDETRSRSDTLVTSMSDTGERAKNVIAEYLQLAPAQIEDDLCLADDLELDSLAKIELVMAFEEEFSIEIGDEAVDMILTVKDAVDAIEVERSGQLANERR